MRPRGPQRKSRMRAFWFRLLPVLLALLVTCDAPAHVRVLPRMALEAVLALGPRHVRTVSWASTLAPIEVSNPSTRASARISLYDPVGDVDEAARKEFERVASREPTPHRLNLRVEQLVFKAAQHFGARSVAIVSGWRERAGRHATGEAIDFRLSGVYAPQVAAYLRGLPRVGVGIYTHPDTQFVHVDVREPSYAWIDGSPPGVHGWERRLWVPHSDKRDAGYEPEMDLPE